MGFRKQYTFWLNYDKPEQLNIAERIDVLKERRQYSSTVRDGLRLVDDLREGNVDVLLELFPDIRQRLGVAEPPPDSKTERDDSQLAAALNNLAVVLQQQKKDVVPALKSSPTQFQLGPPKALELEPLSEVKARQKTDDGGQSSQNFLNSLMALQG